MNTDETRLKQQIAIGQDKQAALDVIVRRAMGALLQYGNVSDNSLKMITCRKDNFSIMLAATENIDAAVLVINAPCWTGFSGMIFTETTEGAPNLKVKILDWDRRVKTRKWQADLFDVFSEDSDWLTSSWESGATPSIVTAIRSLAASKPKPEPKKRKRSIGQAIFSYPRQAD